MNDLLIYIGVAAGTGAAWSVLQFLKNYIDPANENITAVTDFDFKKFGVTVALNTFGGIAGIISAEYLFNVQPSLFVAVACGLMGEQALKLILAAKDRLFPTFSK